MADYNTISSRTYRDKYLKSTLEQNLRDALVAQAICDVDMSDSKRIQSPYGGQPTATISGITGTYSVSNFTTTDDTLTVDHEIKYAEHIFNYDDLLTQFDVYASRVDEMTYAIKERIDHFVLNNLCEDGTGTYSTPSGGFTTASNIITIMANLNSKVAGYHEAYKGTFLVIENSDMVGFEIAQATSGYSTADSVLNNGFYRHFMGVDIYVVRDGTFVTATIGLNSVSNDGHRVFGVKGVSTYATPRGLHIEEKQISGAFGTEVALQMLCGFKVWTPKAGLIIDITITA